MRLRKIEAALEAALEGVFGRIGGGQLHPIEIFRALWSAVEDGCIVSAGATYAPNRVRARIAEADFENLHGVVTRLEREFAAGLQDEAADNGWAFGARILVRLQPDASVRAGTVKVEAMLDEGPIPALLHVETGPCAGQDFALQPGAVLGRAAGCDVVIPDDAVSRRHCRFGWLFDGYQVTDLGSSNGTSVGGRRVSETLLADGDSLTVGNTRIAFQYDTRGAWNE